MGADSGGASCDRWAFSARAADPSDRHGDFALFAVLSVGMAFLLMAWGTEGAGSWFLVVAAFLALLIPYVRHYYILENEVQKMYGQYDVIIEKISKKTGKTGFTMKEHCGKI